MILINPWYSLLFLIPILLIIFYIMAQRRAKRDLSLFAEEQLLSKVADLTGWKLRSRQKILRIIACFFLILALTGPGWGYRWQEVKTKGLEIIIALDTSKSMLANDVKPNRLERSKLALKDFLTRISGNKVGLVAFSGSSFLQCPLTVDYNAFSEALDALNVYTIPRGGTAIGPAIVTTRKAFEASGSGSKILVIITDGENHEGDPVSAAKDAAREGITVYTVGIGSPEGELVVVQDENGNGSYLKDKQGNVVKSSLNEAVLQQIAEAGNGAYVKAGGPSLGLDILYTTQFSKFTKTEIRSKWQKQHLDRFQIPLLIALILFLAEYGLSLTTGLSVRKKDQRSVTGEKRS
jgi:Ca-activated chloride channel family protein